MCGETGTTEKMIGRDNFDSVSKEAFYGGKGSNEWIRKMSVEAYGRDLEQEDTKHLENRDIELQQDADEGQDQGWSGFKVPWRS